MLRISIILALIAAVAVGCFPPNPVAAPPLVPALVRDLDARGDDGHFTFYSLREDRVVPVADSASTGWDLAFRATTILVNGGTSGPGEGGAVAFQDTTFEAVTTAPTDSAFVVDSGIENTETAIPGGAGNGWYDYDFTTGIVSPRPAVLVVRTADGRYAKVAVESYYRGAPDADALDPEEGFRYYTFRYVFQPDGSRRFE